MSAPAQINVPPVLPDNPHPSFDEIYPQNKWNWVLKLGSFYGHWKASDGALLEHMSYIAGTARQADGT